MIKKQDGYVLAYVLVVVLVISIIAVIACTTAARNHEAQIEAINYTQSKYNVEGAMERFAVELESAVVVAADELFVGNEYLPYSEMASVLQDKIDTALLGDDENSGIIIGITGSEEETDYPKYQLDVSGEKLPENEDEGFRFYTHEDRDGNTVSSTWGYFPLDVKAIISRNGLEVEAVFNIKYSAEISYNVDNPDIRLYKVVGVSFEYTSYRVSTVSESEVGE